MTTPGKMKSAEIRKRFIDYFKKHGHTHVPSSRLVPDNDPTLLFTNSGMVQFKNVFLGFDKRPYTRATTSQKCVRAGGKHNDLENVGFTARHHTFFEMLGNFSFGDYFKKDAIHFAWDFLTQDLKISKDKLWITVHVSDDDAAEIWMNQEGVPAPRISRFDADNFWQMGDTGPCGPCSEIFYDHGEKAGCGKPDCKVGCSCDRFTEIWNLVFMQFNKDASGKMTPLPKPSIDTGSGLERVTAVMQGVTSNYETDLFTDLFSVMDKFKDPTLQKNLPVKELFSAKCVVADHARATAFLIADGVIPSNEGAGYVLRRIMRRGIRYGSKISKSSVLLPTVKEVIHLMGDAYPELKERSTFIISTVENEEEKFTVTLSQGNALLAEALNSLKSQKINKLSGETVFKLYDTFGFPVDLTTLIAKESGFEIDTTDFETRMSQQRKTSQASWKGAGPDSGAGALMKAAAVYKPTKFLGYEALSTESEILGLYSADGEKVKELKSQGYAVFQQTPFYAEGGGQVGDHGMAVIKGRVTAEISDTKKFNDVFFHVINVKEGSLKEKEKVELTVDSARRATMRNHSATHLMHAALRKVLGAHVSQAGSLVEPSRLRFDFTHPKPMSSIEIEEVEKLVNQEISSARQVGSQELPYQDAIKGGAMALFGEKYGDKVRVIKMGEFSTELCGGTHVSNTADIRVLKIASEGGVSSGVRRIEAVTGDAAIDFLFHRHHQLAELEDTLRVEEGKAPERVKKVLEAGKKLERDLKNALVQGQTTNVEDILKSARDIKGAKIISAHVTVTDRDILSQLADKIKDKLQSGVIVLIGASADGSPSPLVATVTKDLIGKFHAGNILKGVAAVMDGKGGGRPDFAQGAAPNASKAQAAADKVFDLV